MPLRQFSALVWLAALHVAVLTAGFVAPYAPDRQNRSLPYAPPTLIHLIDPASRQLRRPFVCRQSLNPSGNAAEDCRMLAPIRLLVSAEPHRIAGMTLRRRLFGVDEPIQIHLMGTDAFGRDQFSRFLYGGQVSLIGALLACSISLVIAGFLGLIAGFHGAPLDDVVMGLAELFLVMPWMYALFAVRAFLPLDLDSSRGFWVICAVIGMIGWARPARLLRGVVVSARERDYVAAARGFGASPSYLLIRHILPQTSSVLLPQASLLVARYLLTEVTLSFLGLGVGEPVPSWGNMLSAVQQFSVLVSDWWMLLPAAALVPTLFSFLILTRRVGERAIP